MPRRPTVRGNCAVCEEIAKRAKSGDALQVQPAVQSVALRVSIPAGESRPGPGRGGGRTIGVCRHHADVLDKLGGMFLPGALTDICLQAEKIGSGT